MGGCCRCCASQPLSDRPTKSGLGKPAETVFSLKSSRPGFYHTGCLAFPDSWHICLFDACLGGDEARQAMVGETSWLVVPRGCLLFCLSLSTRRIQQGTISIFCCLLVCWIDEEP